jgi:RHS repeat-associated protein
MKRIRVSKKSAALVGVACAAVGVTGLVWGLRPPQPGAPTRKARKIVATLRAMPWSPLDFDALRRAGGQEHAAAGVPLPSERHPAQVTLPERSTEPLEVKEAATGMSMSVRARNVFNVVAQSADGYYVYPHAYGSGGTLLHRALEDGAEDFVSFETRPAVPEVDYDLALGDGVSGLRLVEGTLELLDLDGAPRLRAEPPFIAGADGVRTDATLAVEGCAVDTDRAAPWGRSVTAPGADTCTLRVRWPDESVVYPAVLDPRWTTTGSMTTTRQGHTATLLVTGNILVAGGTSNGSTALASAELYNRTTGTWAATGSMTGARTLHSATQLNTNSNSTTNGKVLVAGGLNGSTSQNTAQLYSPTAGTWTAGANLNAARHAHTATLLADGRVLVAGGLNGTTTLQTAALYNPASGTGTWTATTGPIPPPGLKNHVAVLLTTSNHQLSNKVLLVGGNNGTSTIASVFLFDPTQSAFSTLTALSSPREGHTATVLPNGNILITGGKNGSAVLATTMIFNPSSGMGTWSSAGTMTTARQLHAAVLLPSGIVENGQVLVAGGNNGTSTLGTAELWNGTSTWTATSPLPAAVQGETATVLPNNMVLIAGGVSGSTTVKTADLYDASFALACTSNSQCATGFCVNGVCCDTACNGGCGVCNLAGKVGTCSPASSTTVCRGQNGACDVAEKCSGTSLTCPSDAVSPLGTVCRGQNGACDVPETCDGTTKACPADGFAPTTTVCRASTGTCDAAETCTGTSPTCPADGFAPATTVCRPSAGGCDMAEKCTGTSSLCPADGVAPAGAVCRPAQSICDVAETCSGSSSVCPTDTFAAAGTECGAATNNAPAPVCSGSAGTCPVQSGTSDILGFEELTDWLLDPSDTAGTTIVGLNSNRTEGESSFEVTAQGSARLNSAPMSSIGSVGPLVLLDILLPTSQANPSSYGDVQMFLNSPTLGLFNVSLGDVLLTGLALGTFQTLAFQMPASAQATIANGIYADLTFSVVLNVASNETGHYLLDNIRSMPDVVPSVLGVAQDGSTLKAVFDYQTTSSTPVNIPYGTANGLTNQSGFIASPSQVPPTTFVPTTHAPFVATLSGSLLTWTVGSHSATATPSSQQLPVTSNGDGTNDATLPDGRKVNLDSTPPASPVAAAGPPVGAPFNGVLTGQFSVSPSGAATYTVPISIPPGVAGMAPNLALVYNSQGGDGIAGPGWSLSGLSTITRCPRTRQQDGYGRPVTMDSLNAASNPDNKSDGLCLDGEKLLEQPAGSGNYVPEKQDFSTITRDTSSDSGKFTVVTKAGETRYYGLQSYDRIDYHGNETETAVWLLDRVVDAWGNYFDVHYNFDDGSNTINNPDSFLASGIRVTAIKYTGSLAQPQSDTFNTITFEYPDQDRPDVRWTTLGPIKIPQKRLLQSITTPAGQYLLSYSGNELQSVGYCVGGSGGTCMQPLSFGWKPTSSGQWPTSSAYALPQTTVAKGKGLKGTQFVDINGDGRLDFVLARTNGINGNNQPQIATLLNCSPAIAECQTAGGWSSQLSGDTQTFPVYLSDGSDNPTGVRFADIDGDGLTDVIVDFANVVKNANGEYVSCPVDLPCTDPTKTPYSPAVWLNRFTVGGGGGWEFHGEYGILPSDPSNSLTNSHRGGGQGIDFTESPSVTVQDINGDGKADLVRVYPRGGGGAGLGFTKVDVLLAQSPCSTQPCTASPWVSQAGAAMGMVFDTTQNAVNDFQLQDVNRDGLPDLVASSFNADSFGGAEGNESVLINQTGASGSPVTFGKMATHISGFGSIPIANLAQSPQFGDIDGDGFYDLVAYYNAAGLYGNTSPAAIIAAVGVGEGTGFGFGLDSTSGAYVGIIKTFTPPEGNDNSGEFTSTGLVPLDNAIALADINGDGLADLVWNHQGRTVGSAPNLGGGQIFLNTGTTWSPPNNATAWQISAGPSRIPGVIPSLATEDFGSAFIDLDGDGLPDLIQADDNATNLNKLSDGLQIIEPNAWMNTSQRQLITDFPSGSAQRANGEPPTTVVSYRSTTSPTATATYKDDDTTFDANTKLLAIPVNVVTNVSSEDASGTGSLNSTTYTYHSLRQDAFGRGPLGFHRVEVYDQASQVRTVTTYAQAYPYTGMPTEVDKYQIVPPSPPPAVPPPQPLPGSAVHLTSKTTTTYCDTAVAPPPAGLGCGPVSAGPIAPGTTTFVYPSEVKDIAYLHPESDNTTDQIGTTTDFTYDASGNSTFTLTSITRKEGSTTESFAKSVQNFYTTNEEQLEGKPDKTTVLASGGTKGTSHTTTFDYATVNTFGGLSSTQLALAKKHIEPDAGWPLRLDTAYKYDQFGNVVVTTSCASDFDSCNATNPPSANPFGPSDPVNHPPFRTTTVSYDPAALGIPVSYGVGRFPATTTNALGHTETTLYDPVLGNVLTKTGPNGIETCYTYDPLGRQTSEIDQCGSAAPLVTTTQYFEVLPTFAICISPPCSTSTGFSPPNSAVVTVTTPPAQSPSWSYRDDQGKATGSLSYAFDGGFIETTTAYNALGRVTQVAKPFHIATVADQPSVSYTKTFYDSFNRVGTVLDPLGDIDGSGNQRSTTITTTYNGSTIETDRQVSDAQGNLRTETRFETKNAIGKVAAVTTQIETGPSTISYGYDADGNLTLTTDPAQNQVQIGYDTRGRKNSTVDPDMGSWQSCEDGFGNVFGQIDAKTLAANPNDTCQSGPLTVTMAYDALGRMLTKTDSTGTAQWVYDVGPGGTPVPGSIGKLAAMVSAPDPKLAGTCAIPAGATVTGGQRAVKSFQYTAFGDLQEEDECADGATFATTYQYDSLRRQSQIRYPVVNNSQLAVGYHYSGIGYLQYLTDDSTDYSVLWQAKAMNELGQVTDEQMRNGVETVSTRNSLTGWLLDSKATAHADNDNLIQHWTYSFDEMGDLLTRGRSDATGVLSSEVFGYDLTNRLMTAVTTTTGSSPRTDSYGYDQAGLGNLTQKGGNTYTYGTGCQAGTSAGPHAVCQVGNGTPFAYDGNGNMTNTGSRSVMYNPSNKVVHVDSDPMPSQGHDTGSVDFMYGADGNRVVQSVTSGGATSRTVYVGLGGTGKSLFERTTKTGAATTYVNFIYAGSAQAGNAFALLVLYDDGSPPVSRYYSVDHLGSVTAMTDEHGRLSKTETSSLDATALGYDAWGARRNADASPASYASFDVPVGGREFTGQEQIPDVGLVNMNGRLYDPSLGRFLSPDANIQFVADLQSYNRYTYVENNPLRYTDPTGYWLSDVGNWFAKTFSNPLTDVELAFSLAICAGSGVGCFIVGLEFAVLNAAVAIGSGAGAGSTILNAAIGLGVGIATGGLVNALGGNALVGLVAGSVSAAVTTGIANAISSDGRYFWGWNMLGAAVLSAAQGAATYGLHQAIAVSQSSTGDGGSGAARVQKAETVDSVLADAGYGQQKITDADLLAAYPDAGSPTRADAALGALTRYNGISTSTDWEIGGLTYTLDGAHYATPGVTDMEADTVDAFAAQRYLPDGAVVDGWWHTHGAYNPAQDNTAIGGPDQNEIFSTGDWQVQHQGLPQIPGVSGSLGAAYWATPSGAAYEYIPQPNDSWLFMRSTRIGSTW